MTRIEIAMDAIRQRIAGHSLLPGDKLPSVRNFAKLMQMSTSTIVEAYARLSAEGIIQSQQGSGFYVSRDGAHQPLFEAHARHDRSIDPFWVSRQSLEAADTALKPGCGWLPPSWLPQEPLRRALRSLSRATPEALTEYGEPLGQLGLRQIISRRMADRGVYPSPSQIMLTESGTQAIDLICRLLLKPGATVLVDDPCYFNFQALLRAHRANLVSVAYNSDGPDTEQFAAALVQHRPRLYLTNSGIHNPTGATLAPAIAHQILKLAEQHDLTIVEDDIFSDFEHRPAPRLAAFDGLHRVAQIGSFSKTLSAAARCGFVAARADWINDLIDLKIATSFGGNGLSAELVRIVLTDGSYRKHMDTLKQRLSRAMIEVTRKLETLGITPLLKPTAGMFLWCRLPDAIDAADLAREALAVDIVLAPGNVFSASQSATHMMRFNVAQCDDPRVFEFLEHAIAKYRGKAI